jgi:hypothetical protein
MHKLFLLIVSTMFLWMGCANLESTPMDKPQVDESRASEFVGKTILIGVTYLDHEGKEIGQAQWSGRIETYSNTVGIRVRLDDSSDFCCLPPAAEAIHKAEPAIYTLRSSGKKIENPDYTTSWTCQRPDPKEKQMQGEFTPHPPSFF